MQMADAAAPVPFVERRKPGRPRCSELESAIRKAALDMLEQQGFASLTIEGVAARAGVGKATIYRWWPTKSSLVIDAFVEAYNDTLDLPDTGSLREDLLAPLRKLLAIADSRRGRILAEMVAAFATSPELAETFYNRWISARRRVLGAVLDRAIERGEFDASIPQEAFLDALCGATYYQLMLMPGPPEEERLGAAVDLLLRAARADATVSVAR